MSSIEQPKVVEHDDHAEWDKAVRAQAATESINRVQDDPAQRMPRKFAEQVKAAEEAEREKTARAMLKELESQVHAAEEVVALKQKALGDFWEKHKQSELLQVNADEVTQLEGDVFRAMQLHASKTKLFETSRVAFESRFHTKYELNPSRIEH